VGKRVNDEVLEKLQKLDEKRIESEKRVDQKLDVIINQILFFNTNFIISASFGLDDRFFQENKYALQSNFSKKLKKIILAIRINFVFVGFELFSFARGYFWDRKSFEPGGRS